MCYLFRSSHFQEGYSFPPYVSRSLYFLSEESLQSEDPKGLSLQGFILGTERFLLSIYMEEANTISPPCNSSMTLHTFESCNISLVTFNCRGFRSSMEYLRHLTKLIVTLM